MSGEAHSSPTLSTFELNFLTPFWLKLEKFPSTQMNIGSNKNNLLSGRVIPLQLHFNRICNMCKLKPKIKDLCNIFRSANLILIPFLTKFHIWVHVSKWCVGQLVSKILRNGLKTHFPFNVTKHQILSHVHDQSHGLVVASLNGVRGRKQGTPFLPLPQWNRALCA
jgi:hypothetical protein